jgi:predicted nuclease of predicted toxin-antitoxin system
MRITVYDVFSYLAGGMTVQQVLEDFPYLTKEDIQACYAFAADRERLSSLAHSETSVWPNLSPRLVVRLADLHPESSHVFSLGIDQASDDQVWERARQEGYTIVTKDSDLSDLSVLRGFPPKVIWVRLGNCTTQQIEDLIRNNSEAVTALESDLTVGLLSLFWSIWPRPPNSRVDRSARSSVDVSFSVRRELGHANVRRLPYCGDWQ